jgi:hypothetical protein
MPIYVLRSHAFSNRFADTGKGFLIVVYTTKRVILQATNENDPVQDKYPTFRTPN